MVSSQRGRYGALDGLRGVAAISVLIMHVSILLDHSNALPKAGLAVDLFFMLSGFVLGACPCNGILLDDDVRV